MEKSTLGQMLLRRDRPSNDCFRRGDVSGERDNMSCEIDEKTTVRSNVRLGGSGGDGGANGGD